jgi:hypothetical protein
MTGKENNPTQKRSMTKHGVASPPEEQVAKEGDRTSKKPPARDWRREALSERWSELAMRVATTPAKTNEGLIAKIALIASGYAEDDLDGTYDGILASAALDARALANVRA